MDCIVENYVLYRWYSDNCSLFLGDDAFFRPLPGYDNNGPTKMTFPTGTGRENPFLERLEGGTSR